VGLAKWNYDHGARLWEVKKIIMDRATRSRDSAKSKSPGLTVKIGKK
jgi:hypothetical protein